MRPPEFTGGNNGGPDLRHFLVFDASMRPPEFTGGNADLHGWMVSKISSSFNEAAGIHRRKPWKTGVLVRRHPTLQ